MTSSISAEKFDSSDDTYAHIRAVRAFIDVFRIAIRDRGQKHDLSKLSAQEKPLRDLHIAALRRAKFGSEEYERISRLLGPAIEHHHANNRHHPEHFENGVSGMNLVDLVEMFCDWMAAGAAQGGIMVDVALKRHGITGQLADVIQNTVRDWPDINASTRYE